MLYFDYAATTKPKNEILALYQQVQASYWYNPSSLYKGGLLCQNLLNQSTTSILEMLNCPNHRVVFTSGATEANNMAILGICLKEQPKSTRIITTKIEHPSVLNVYKKLETKGYDVVFLDCDTKGVIDLKQLEGSINQQTILVSIMWVNNIVGSIQPIKKIIEILKKYPKIKLHVDAVQGLGKIKPDFSFSDVDLITMSAHKIGGVKGSGFLAFYHKTALVPVYEGAYQQEKIKSGTIDLAGAVTCAKALKINILEINQKISHVSKIYQYAYQELSKTTVVIHSNIDYQSPYILTFSIKGLNSETIMHILEQENIYVGIGSACHSKIKTAEPTIYNMTKDEKLATSFIRVCFNEETTQKDIDTLIKVIKKIIA